MPALRAPFEHVEPQSPRSPNLRSAQPILRNLDISLRQEERRWRVRYARKNKEPDQRHGNGENSVDDKEPPPPWHSPNSREVGVCGCLEIPADHLAKWIADEPGPGALEQVGAGVPRAWICPVKLVSINDQSWNLPKMKCVPAKTGASNMPTRNRKA